MRKRSEVGPELPVVAEKPIIARERHIYPIENDLSDMAIALKSKGYKVGVFDVGHWEPQVRHIVAMWLNGDLQESDIPEAIKSFKVAEEEPAFGGFPKTEDKAPVARKRVEVTAEAPKASVMDLSQGTSLNEGFTGEILCSSRLPPETTTISWPEEKFFPIAGNYSSYTVPSIIVTVNFKPGENKSTRIRAEYAELEKIGEELRERKRVSFLRALKGVKDDPK